jgi:murein DD-endopeptidase MepM/ murein hydrolase activator NlpD
MSAGQDTYAKIVSKPFDGTTMPIVYVPDWTKSANQDKSKKFEDISISEYLPLPEYDPFGLLDAKNPSKNTTLLRYTYITTYMGTYNLDYHEYAWGHLWVDIRAPIGTPVLSIANGVVVRAIEADATGNKFIVVRHDNVPINGKKISLYSGYLHLSEILAKEWDLVRKGDMIGRVGMTGIATTPHLHLQIDTSDAPFHPYWHFTSSESRGAGLSFFDAVNKGLNKDKALKYTLHPMHFIATYLWGTGEVEKVATLWNNPSNSTPISVSTSKPIETSPTIAAYIASNEADCIGKRFSDVPEKSSFWKTLYPLVDRKCLFLESEKTLGVRSSITFREALINIMRYFDIAPTNGTSHFLDIPLWDSMQGYALVAYRRGIISGSHAHPEAIMTREMLADLIVKIKDTEKNPSQIRIYNDVDALNPYYPAIQDYAYMVRVRGGRFYPKTIVTKAMMVQMLSNIKKN